MTAEVLRKAASRIRHDVEFGQAHGDDTFLLAVADWLGGQAVKWNYLATQRESSGVDCPGGIWQGQPEQAARNADYHAKHALRVARAYLGADS